ncbi:hypothetical protein BGX38DRAFT_1173940, partial [Terfezia claveryi]
MTKEELEKEQTQAKKARANLLHTWSQKAQSISESDSDHDTDIEEIQPPKRQKKNLSRNSEILDVVRNNGHLMAAAVKELANAISHSSRGGNDLEAKVVKLEECIQKTNRRAEHRAEETNQILRELLSRRS